ncbi:MAG: hypothetical protein DMF64_04415 [Acidobacteria bacterium]|nr:MAG: hypothetical protein DMF64_04415 [Acidobacteriota bacterium]
MRAVLIIVGIVLAATGGVIAYRAAFVAPPAFIVNPEGAVHELPNIWRIMGGLVLLVAGLLIAFCAARRRA